MKVYKLLSSNSQYPLAEVRVQGNSLDFYVDNTDGKLSSKIKNFLQLQNYVKRSSILKLVQDSEPTVNFLRYVMNNGDVVEITTDGHTVLLNEKLLNPEEKDSLLEAIRRGDIKVARKSDPSQPVPVFPTTQAQGGEISKQPKSQVSQAMMDEVAKTQSNLKNMRSMSTKSYDYEIENGDYSGAEDPDYCKRMLYALRYGESNG